MQKMFSRWLCALALCGSLPAVAATTYGEAPGAADHPLVGRFNGAILHKYGTISFEHVDVKLPDKRTESAEGKVLNYFYLGPKGHSDLEVFRNYKQSLEKQGFKVLHVCEDGPVCVKQDLAVHATKWTDDSRAFVGGSFYMNNLGSRPFRFLMARLARPAGDVTVVLTLRGGYWADRGFDTDYFVQVIEAQPMQTDQVTVLKADTMGQGLAVEGKIALYGIYFDTGNAEVKPESTAQLEEMGKLLTQSMKLKVFIVGHTDNQGVVDANLALSLRRAQAVAAALTKDYKIDSNRLSARGVANFAPVAINETDIGRAKNRRVELVVQ
jgi:outer membrane protein OmpA-like peptidoglycan-associated protein